MFAQKKFIYICIIYVLYTGGQLIGNKYIIIIIRMVYKISRYSSNLTLTIHSNLDYLELSTSFLHLAQDVLNCPPLNFVNGQSFKICLKLLI